MPKSRRCAKRCLWARKFWCETSSTACGAARSKRAKIFDDNKGGRPAKFCRRAPHPAPQPRRQQNRRLVSFMEHIVQSAVKDDYDLAQASTKASKFGRDRFKAAKALWT